MTYVTVYLLCAIVLMIAFAVRTPKAELSYALFWAIMWPIALVMIAIFVMLAIAGRETDIVVNKFKLFEFRRLGRPRGFGVTAFGVELQVWKKK